MKAPRSRRSEAIFGVGIAVVLALYLTQFWLDERSWVVPLLACIWLACFAAYLTSRALDVRRGTQVRVGWFTRDETVGLGSTFFVLRGT